MKNKAEARLMRWKITSRALMIKKNVNEVQRRGMQTIIRPVMLCDTGFSNYERTDKKNITRKDVYAEMDVCETCKTKKIRKRMNGYLAITSIGNKAGGTLLHDMVMLREGYPHRH